MQPVHAAIPKPRATGQSNHRKQEWLRTREPLRARSPERRADTVPPAPNPLTAYPVTRRSRSPSPPAIMPPRRERRLLQCTLVAFSLPLAHDAGISRHVQSPSRRNGNVTSRPSGRCAGKPAPPKRAPSFRVFPLQTFPRLIPFSFTPGASRLHAGKNQAQPTTTSKP